MTINETMELAYRLQNEGKTDQAESLYKEILKVQPDNVSAYYNLGIIFQDKEQLDEAMLCYKKALQLNANFADLYFNLGVIFHNKGLFDEAINNYQKALELEPNSSDINNNIGAALKDKGQLDEAMLYYTKALDLAPYYDKAYNNLGIALAEKGEHDKAIIYFQKALQINPYFADAANNLGNILKEKGRIDQAVKYFEKAVRIDPNLIIYNNLFLSKSKGVIHVGANTGQERELYAAYGLNVIWIEPIPEVYDRLNTLIDSYPKQKAFRYLVTDADDKEYLFHISSKGGGASSIYDLAGHKELWPDVTYTQTITLKSITLSSFITKERVELTDYDVLVLDTQGSELLVLRGAINLLPHIKYVRAEVPDFESYSGCCKLPEMDDFFKEHNFRRIAQGVFAHKKGIGTYYEVLYASYI